MNHQPLPHFSLQQLQNTILQARNFIAQSQPTLNNTYNSQLLHQQLTSKVQDIRIYQQSLQQQANHLEPANTSSFFEKKQGKFIKSKLNLYIWQILNFLVINKVPLNQNLIDLASLIMKVNIKIQFSQSPNTIKNSYIFINNFLSKMKQQAKQYKKYKEFINNSLYLILQHHFQPQKQQKQSLFQDKKGQQHYLQQAQWIGYIFIQLFQLTYYPINNLSFIQTFSLHHQPNTYHFLHMIGNYFQQMVDKRSTTQLVSGFECKLNDVKEMYNSKSNCLIIFKITSYDLTFLLKLFKKSMEQYHLTISSYIKAKIVKNQTQDIMNKWKQTLDLLTQLSHILNCILFIGGYNNTLQNFIVQHLFQQDPTFLQYFQLIYLIYRNIQSTRYQSKLTLLVDMEKQTKNKLFSLLKEDSTEVSIKQLSLQQILGQGQLMSIIRLLTNLVHINHRAQTAFEKQLKYLHMTLSLTHDSVSQVTMKQWAILFIKNVCEFSEILREEIGRVQMQMKVE